MAVPSVTRGTGISRFEPRDSSFALASLGFTLSFVTSFLKPGKEPFLPHSPSGEGRVSTAKAIHSDEESENTHLLIPNCFESVQ